jgi:hypothetical protein
MKRSYLSIEEEIDDNDAVINRLRMAADHLSVTLEEDNGTSKERSRSRRSLPYYRTHLGRRG